jgi:DNA-binding NtrC family response regulator
LSGISVALQKLREEIEFVATTNQPVLLLGETGTGKSLCARLIHDLSKRRAKKCIHYQPNFGGGDIVQSELFGHTKGSFTGAVENRRGLVVEADGGTLFIDELDAVPAETQVKLLDLVQEQRIRPIGSDVYQKVDCRCIAATNRPIQEALDSGLIRRDLHHRLAHCVISIPPLRERLEDLPLLIESSLRELREREVLNVFEVDSQVLARCQAYAWPGNIRELRGVIESAAYRAQFKGRSVISSDDVRLGAGGSSSSAPAISSEKSFHDQVEAFKRALIRQALEACGGNQVQAATMLGIDRGTIRRLS